MSPGWLIGNPIPSPDGRYLAFTSIPMNQMRGWWRIFDANGSTDPRFCGTAAWKLVLVDHSTLTAGFGATLYAPSIKAADLCNVRSALRIRVNN